MLVMALRVAQIGMRLTFRPRNSIGTNAFDVDEDCAPV